MDKQIDWGEFFNKEDGILKTIRIVKSLRNYSCDQECRYCGHTGVKVLSREELIKLSEGVTSPLRIAAIVLEFIERYLEGNKEPIEAASDDKTERIRVALWPEFKDDPLGLLELADYTLHKGNYVPEGRDPNTFREIDHVVPLEEPYVKNLSEMTNHLKIFLNDPPQHERRSMFH